MHSTARLIRQAAVLLLLTVIGSQAAPAPLTSVRELQALGYWDVSQPHPVQLTGAVTPHFALHVRNRLRNLVADLPASNPARVLAEAEIEKLERLAVEGERRGAGSHAGEQRLADQL